MPTRKYEADGGPGLAAIVTLLRDSSSKATEDIERFVQATALNWVIAATDAHAKNYALLHGSRGDVRLAPFYDILSYLPYADPALHRVKLAMKIGGNYLVRRIGRTSWEAFAASNGLSTREVLRTVADVLDRLPAIIDAVASDSIGDGLEPERIDALRRTILERASGARPSSVLRRRVW